MSYQPFLIANQRTGLELDLEPWLLPGDAYTKLDNFYLHQGKLIKRRGRNLFADLGVSLPIMGLFNHVNNVGTQQLLAFTTKRAYAYTGSSFTDLNGSDYFTGDDYEFFWMSNWLNKGFITNGVDKIQTYDGTTLAELDIDLAGGTTSDVIGPYSIHPFKNRLILLSPVEYGVRKAQRARWSAINSYTSWPDDNYIDAPTSEWIQFACFLRNELVVIFERSIWVLRYTGDSRQPFAWEKRSSNEGTVSPMSMIDFENEILGMGVTRIVGFDGQTVYNIDQKIPKMLLDMNQSLLNYIYAGINEPLDQVYMSFPSAASGSYNDAILVLNFMDNSFSIYDFGMHSFGYYETYDAITWAELTKTWPEYSFRWGDRDLQAGYPLLLGGDTGGKIWELNMGNLDNTSLIKATAITGRINPFLKEGQQARLGFVDLLVDRQPSSTLTIKLYGGYSLGTPYKTVTPYLDDGKGRDKAWVRIPVNQVDASHQLEIINNDAGAITIHAIVPWMKPGPRLYR